MGMLSSQVVNAAQAPEEAGRTLESLLVQKLLQASGAFKGTGEAGSQLHNDLFVETLADAVSKSGGFGLAETLKNELTGPMHAGKIERPGGPDPEKLKARQAAATGLIQPEAEPEPPENPQAAPGSPHNSQRALIAYGRRAEESRGRVR